MKTFTLSGSQISPFEFLEQRSVSVPCSQPFASLLRFINPSFTPTSHPAQAPGPLFLGQPVFPFWEYLLGYCKGKGRDVKRKKSPPKQLTCRILLWSSHQQPTTLLSETLNNRVFSISHLQVGIFEAQETLKIRWRMGKQFCKQVPSLKIWMQNSAHRNCSSLSCCESSPWGCSSQQFSRQRCGMTSCPADCSMWYLC